MKKYIYIYISRISIYMIRERLARFARSPIIIRIIIGIFAENTSFRSYGGIFWPRMPLSTPEPQNTDTNGIHATWI